MTFTLYLRACPSAKSGLILRQNRHTKTPLELPQKQVSICGICVGVLLAAV